jgi:beta-phosphoglucomutase-like phosphatase (HAD superfamily)
MELSKSLHCLSLMHSAESIFFDLDGVLWSSNKAHEQAYRVTCGEFGFQSVDYQYLAGKSTVAATHQIFAHNGIRKSIRYGELHGSFVARKKEVARSLLQIMSDSELQIWNGFEAFQGARFALVTGSSPESVALYLTRIGTNPFEVIIDGTFPNPKPSPEGYLKAGILLESNPDTSIIFEDSPSGLVSAATSELPFAHIYGDWHQCNINHSEKHFKGCFRSLWEVVGNC